MSHHLLGGQRPDRYAILVGAANHQQVVGRASPRAEHRRPRRGRRVRAGEGRWLGQKQP
ncbi:MAG: hypothetical protein HY352_02785, partial [Candidatus Omnitrophica bacterium]|nr:hypothetical protein [Candidatus Omnitrophota bacterium]